MSLPIRTDPLFIAKVATLNLNSAQMEPLGAETKSFPSQEDDPHAFAGEHNYSNGHDPECDKIAEDLSLDNHGGMASLDALPIEVWHFLVRLISDILLHRLSIATFFCSSVTGGV
jgi:hypothetical protein